ncbi:hypothetical protein OC861_002585, partial [Tilletia horrida]
PNRAARWRRGAPGLQSATSFQRAGSDVPIVRVAADKIKLEKEKLQQEGDGTTLISSSWPRTTVRSPAEAFDINPEAIQVVLPPELRQGLNAQSDRPTAKRVCLARSLPSPLTVLLSETRRYSQLSAYTHFHHLHPSGGPSSFLSLQLEDPPSQARKGLMDASQLQMSSAQQQQQQRSNQDAAGEAEKTTPEILTSPLLLKQHHPPFLRSVNW